MNSAVSVPFIALALVATFVAVRFAKAKPVAIFVGVFLGLALSTTGIGGPISNGIVSATKWTVDSITAAAAGPK